MLGSDILTDKLSHSKVPCSIPCNVPQYLWWEAIVNMNIQNSDGNYHAEFPRMSYIPLHLDYNT